MTSFLHKYTSCKSEQPGNSKKKTTEKKVCNFIFGTEFIVAEIKKTKLFSLKAPLIYFEIE